MSNPTTGIVSQNSHHLHRVDRRFPIGAEVVVPDQVHFRVWAPAAKRLEVVLSGESSELTREAGGYFAALCPGKAGDRYQFRVDGANTLYPDPASRFQPEGPHGPSEVVDASRFEWTDAAWSGLKVTGQ